MSNTHRPLIGQAYSADEMARIAALADGSNSSAAIAAAFPGRSVKAVRFVMWKMRAKAGKARARTKQTPRPNSRYKDGAEPQMLNRDDPGLPCSWLTKHKKAMAESNSAFVAALRAA